MAIQTETFDLPDFWACPLLYGDYSGLSDYSGDPKDDEQINAFTDWMIETYGSCRCISVAPEDCGDFRHSHDASRFGVLACNVVPMTFDVTRR